MGCVNVSIINDEVLEDDEMFMVTLAAPADDVTTVNDTLNVILLNDDSE